ncbi:MAG: chromosome partitioning protein ParB [Gammaproteobacteria bacterium]|nr:MAG: chromosome partitioning protein ParB [Gammaproteobacteria bacterium]
MAKKQGLGKGLDALLGGIENIQKIQKIHNDNELQFLNIEHIQPGKYQPRVNFDKKSLQDLANSLKKQGMVQPIVVRSIGKKFEIIAGERRWRAAAIAKLDKIPVIIKKVDDETAAAVSLVENIQREDLNIIEEASSFERFNTEFKMTHQQIANLVSRSRASITNTMRLLELNQDVKRHLIEKKLDMGHARALLGLSNTQQKILANKIIKNNLNVRQAESLANSQKTQKNKQQKNKVYKDSDIEKLEQNLSEKISAKINILHNKSGKGKIVIHYYDLDELDGIIKKF